MTSLQEDDKDIVRKIDELQAGLRNNKNDQAMQEKEIANQKIKLEELKTRVVKQWFRISKDSDRNCCFMSHLINDILQLENEIIKKS